MESDARRTAQLSLREEAVDPAWQRSQGYDSVYSTESSDD
jgi:hypothetical protein